MMQTASIDKLTQAVTQRGRPFRILIVDDERYVREVFQDYCALTNAFQIELAHSGQEAIEKITNGTWDLVTLDLIMPELSGLDVLIALKRLAPQLPVVIVTGNATDRLVHEAGMLGASRVLYKPVLLEDFLDAISSVLAGQKGY